MTTSPNRLAHFFPWPALSEVPAIASRLFGAGFDAVALKVADGGRPFTAANFPLYGYQSQLQVVSAFRAAGLKVYAWVYLYAAHADEAKVATAAMATGLYDGLLVDVEAEFAEDRFASAGDPPKSTRLAAYLSAVRHASKWLGYTSFWNVSGWPGILWNQWNQVVDAALPQVYWWNTVYVPALTPQQLVAKWRSEWKFTTPPRQTIPIFNPNTSGDAPTVALFRDLADGPSSWWRYPFSQGVYDSIASLPETSTGADMPLIVGPQRVIADVAQGTPYFDAPNGNIINHTGEAGVYEWYGSPTAPDGVNRDPSWCMVVGLKPDFSRNFSEATIARYMQREALTNVRVLPEVTQAQLDAAVAAAKLATSQEDAAAVAALAAKIKAAQAALA